MQHDEEQDPRDDQLQDQQYEKLKIILVDGSKDMLRRMHTALFEIKYEWVASMSAQQVFRQVQKTPYAAVVAGAQIGSVRGTELLGRIANVAPHTMRLLVADERMDLEAALNALDLGEAHHILRIDNEKTIVRGIVDQAIQTYRTRQAMVEYREESKSLKHELNDQERAVRQANRRNEALKQEVEMLQEAASEASQDAQRRFKESLGILTKMQALQNPGLTQHMMRVSKVAVQIGQMMNLDKDTLFQLEIAAMLHDVGKLVLPASILELSPHQLDPLSLKKYRAHAKLGEDLVGKISNLEQAGTFIRSHHEQYDGRGYPDQLKADQIPIGARIIAVANMYDKLCFQARRRMEPRHAFETLRRRAESFFDPQVVAVLESIVREITEAKANPDGLLIS